MKIKSIKSALLLFVVFSAMPIYIESRWVWKFLFFFALGVYMSLCALERYRRGYVVDVMYLYPAFSAGAFLSFLYALASASGSGH